MSLLIHSWRCTQEWLKQSDWHGKCICQPVPVEAATYNVKQLLALLSPVGDEPCIQRGED